jgi:di/tricarboxylate transporter
MALLQSGSQHILPTFFTIVKLLASMAVESLLRVRFNTKPLAALLLLLLLLFSATLNQRERRLLEYGTHLFSGGSHWQLGATYLSKCPTYGRRYLEEFVVRVAVDTDFKAHKLIQYVALPIDASHVRAIIG